MKKLTILLLVCLCTLSFSQTNAQTEPWSQKMANSIMLSKPSGYGTWDYVTGTVMSGFQVLYQTTGNTSYLSYIEKTVKLGTINTNTKTLDNVKPGTACLFMYSNTSNATDKAAYKSSADLARGLLNTTGGISRTAEGGLWHKDPAYRQQMWGDGLYMAQPFMAQHTSMFNPTATANYDDVAKQFILFENHARNAQTGLLYHGWSADPTNTESKSWADATTGCSKSFWARAMGWYIMGLVDALDYLPADHPKRPDLIGILNRLVDALLVYQQPSGCWYDVVDQGTRCSSIAPSKCNYLEASASCMITYSILKSVRLGYLNLSYLTYGTKGYEGILSQFVTANGTAVTIKNCCQVSGLGGSSNRNGTFDYYMSEPIVTNDGKALGPFILASLEYEALSVSTSVGKSSAASLGFSVSTNAKTGELSVCFSTTVSSPVKLSIVDISGKTVFVREISLPQGPQSLRYSLSHLLKGYYIVYLVQGNTFGSQKILVQ